MPAHTQFARRCWVLLSRATNANTVTNRDRGEGGGKGGGGGAGRRRKSTSAGKETGKEAGRRRGSTGGGGGGGGGSVREDKGGPKHRQWHDLTKPPTSASASASSSSSASAMDPDEVLTFRHFIVCAWVFCTFEKSGLVSLAFMSYDEDRSGRLDWTAMEKMVCEVYVSSC